MSRSLFLVYSSSVPFKRIELLNVFVMQARFPKAGDGYSVIISLIFDDLPIFYPYSVQTIGLQLNFVGLISIWLNFPHFSYRFEYSRVIHSLRIAKIVCEICRHEKIQSCDNICNIKLQIKAESDSQLIGNSKSSYLSTHKVGFKNFFKIQKKRYITSKKSKSIFEFVFYVKNKVRGHIAVWNFVVVLFLVSNNIKN